MQKVNCKPLVFSPFKINFKIWINHRAKMLSAAFCRYASTLGKVRGNVTCQYFASATDTRRVC